MKKTFYTEFAERTEIAEKKRLYAVLDAIPRMDAARRGGRPYKDNGFGGARKDR